MKRPKNSLATTSTKGNPWTLGRIEQMRRSGVEESLTLDYKRAGALDRKLPKTSDELTKDVSAFANSSGGVLIYGVGEDPTNKHLPGELDPIKRSEVSKEWLESIILNIQPRIDGFKIHPIPIDNDQVLYVIEIPQSTTAHQARDHRYYKRWNFSSQPMEDYEIRDVMNRAKHPHVVLTFELERYIEGDPDGFPVTRRKREEKLSLNVHAENQGAVLAQYMYAKVFVPLALIDAEEAIWRGFKPTDDMPEFITFGFDNKKARRSLGKGDIHFEPILPELKLDLGSCSVSLDALLTQNRDLEIVWQVHADNAPPVEAPCRLRDIPVIDNRRS